MKIAIDCRMSGMSGIGVYLDNILEYLLASNQTNDYLLIGNIAKLSGYESHSNCKVLHADISIFSFDELFRFPVKEINSCDIFYTPNFNIPGGIKIPILSSIHDVVFMDVPDLTGKIGLFIRRLALKRALRISKKVITVSEFSKLRISHHFKTIPEIILAGGGVNNELKRFNRGKATLYNFPYVLFIGNIKKHKGLRLLLAAFHLAKEMGLRQKLVIVGNYDAFRTSDDEIIRLIDEENENIVFTGSISNKQLFDSITHASLLVQPSRYEGFGLPPLEALYLGCPVLISDIPVFREIYQDFPVTFFQLDNIQDLADKLFLNCTEKQDLPDLRNRIESRFSFEHSAEIILKTLNDLHLEH